MNVNEAIINGPIKGPINYIADTVDDRSIMYHSYKEGKQMALKTQATLMWGFIVTSFGFGVLGTISTLLSV